jgi:hypothetical protein
MDEILPGIYHNGVSATGQSISPTSNTNPPGGPKSCQKQHHVAAAPLPVQRTRASGGTREPAAKANTSTSSDELDINFAASASSIFTNPQIATKTLHAGRDFSTISGSSIVRIAVGPAGQWSAQRSYMNDEKEEAGVGDGDKGNGEPAADKAKREAQGKREERSKISALPEPKSIPQRHKAQAKQ